MMKKMYTGNFRKNYLEKCILLWEKLFDGKKFHLLFRCNPKASINSDSLRLAAVWRAHCCRRRSPKRGDTQQQRDAANSPFPNDASIKFRRKIQTFHINSLNASNPIPNWVGIGGVKRNEFGDNIHHRLYFRIPIYA